MWSLSLVFVLCLINVVLCGREGYGMGKRRCSGGYDCNYPGVGNIAGWGCCCCQSGCNGGNGGNGGNQQCPKDCQDSIDKLQEQVDLLQKCVKRLEKANEIVFERLEKTDKKIAALEIESSSLRKDLEDTENDVSNVENTVEGLENDIEAIEIQASLLEPILEETLQTLGIMNATQQAQQDILETAVEDIYSNSMLIADLTQEVEMLINITSQDDNSTIVAIYAEIDEIDAKFNDSIQNLEGNLTDIDNRLEVVEYDVSVLETNATTAAADIASIEADITSLESDSNATASRIDDLEASVASDFILVNQSINRLDSDITRVEAEFQANDTAISSDLATLQTQVDDTGIDYEFQVTATGDTLDGTSSGKRIPFDIIGSDRTNSWNTSTNQFDVVDHGIYECVIETVLSSGKSVYLRSNINGTQTDYESVANKISQHHMFELFVGDFVYAKTNNGLTDSDIIILSCKQLLKF